ncbi:orotidine-5'-phosphate decarboxylase [Candidatus Roizmanbacteria bacterium]|nr:orotidine-5'-phosphate decarboxylase [Candidatus Roizmanbacteria bacterium]
MNFQKKLDKIIKKNNSLVCVGLDSEYEKIPERFNPASLKLRRARNPQFEFNKWIIDQTHDLVCAYKPNSAFYEGVGIDGIKALKQTCDYIRLTHPEICIILDAKRGDIGNTNKGYVKFAFDYLGADAITVMPYMGIEALQAFLARKEKGIIIGCRSSNPGAKEFQDLVVAGTPLYLRITQDVVTKWNKNKNCLLFVGATYPQEMSKIRKIVGDLTLLTPGINVQGGDVEKIVKAGLNSKKTGLIVNSSRGIIFSEDPRKETKKLRDEIHRYRK